MFSEWPPTPAGTPWALIKSTSARSRRSAAAHHVVVGLAAVRIQQVAPRSTWRLMVSVHLGLALASGTQTMVWIFSRRLWLYLVIGPQQAGSNWIVLMPQRWAQFQGLEDFRLGVVRGEELRGVRQVAAVGPAADQVAADEDTAERNVADLAAGRLPGAMPVLRLFALPAGPPPLRGWRPAACSLRCCSAQRHARRSHHAPCQETSPVGFLGHGKPIPFCFVLTGDCKSRAMPCDNSSEDFTFPRSRGGRLAVLSATIHGLAISVNQQRTYERMDRRCPGAPLACTSGRKYTVFGRCSSRSPLNEPN